jgi:hypothetical protein
MPRYGLMLGWNAGAVGERGEGPADGANSATNGCQIGRVAQIAMLRGMRLPHNDQ